MILMGYSGAQGTLIYEKNLKSKISCQTPFNKLIAITLMLIENIQEFINRNNLFNFKKILKYIKNHKSA